MENKSEVKSFFEGWNLYQQVIKYNYMSHSEIIEWLIPRFVAVPKGLKVLELGCGDAYIITQLTKNCTIDAYSGIDLSEHALEFAEENLKNKIHSFSLIAGNMSEAIKEVNEKFDFILASYSIHHLHTPDKQKLFFEINKKLAPGGKFLMIDIVNYEKEDRIAYLNRGNNWYSKAWNKMTKEQLTSVYEHTISSDFPESFNTLKSLSESAGLKLVEADYLDDVKLFGALEFSNK